MNALATPFARVAGFYGAIFLAMGAYLPFWPLWLADWGLSEKELGTLMTVSILVRVLAGVAVPYLADRMGTPRVALAGSALAGLVFFVLQALAPDRITLFACFLLFATFLAAIFPIMEGAGYAAAKREGFSYGLARSVGSATFIATNLLCGYLIARYGVDVAYWWVIAMLILTAFYGAIYPVEKIETRTPIRFRDATRVLLTDRAFVVFAVGGALIHASHASYYTFGSLHWRNIGYSETVIGGLWAVGVVAEIGLFLVADRLFRRWSAPVILAVAGAITALRWGVTAFDPGLPVLILAQSLHAASFAMAHLGALRFISEAAPKHLLSTAQGLYTAVFAGILMAGANELAASRFEAMGGGVYLISAGFAVVGTGFAVLLARMWDGRRIEDVA